MKTHNIKTIPSPKFSTLFILYFCGFGALTVANTLILAGVIIYVAS